MTSIDTNHPLWEPQLRYKIREFHNAYVQAFLTAVYYLLPLHSIQQYRPDFYQTNTYQFYIPHWTDEPNDAIEFLRNAEYFMQGRLEWLHSLDLTYILSPEDFYVRRASYTFDSVTIEIHFGYLDECPEGYRVIPVHPYTYPLSMSIYDEFRNFRSFFYEFAKQFFIEEDDRLELSYTINNSEDQDERTSDSEDDYMPLMMIRGNILYDLDLIYETLEIDVIHYLLMGFLSRSYYLHNITLFADYSSINIRIPNRPQQVQIVLVMQPPPDEEVMG